MKKQIQKLKHDVNVHKDTQDIWWGVMRTDVETSKTGEENSEQKRWYGLFPFLAGFEKMTENSFDI